MAEQKDRNDDFEIPHNPKLVITITTTFEALKLPMFWGPGQEYTGLYVVPHGIKQEFLRIPIICRFIHCGESEFETDKYKKPPPPPPPGNLPVWWQIIRITFREPPFPYSFVIYYHEYNKNGPTGRPGALFDTTKYIMLNGNLVDVGSSLSVGMRWTGEPPPFSWIQNGYQGPGWYYNSFKGKVEFF